SSQATGLTFSPTGSQTYVATDDLPGIFQAATLNFSGTSTGSITIGGGSISSIQLRGFTNPAINNTGTSPVYLTGRISAPFSSYSINIGSTNATVTAINAVLSGATSINVNNAGTGSIVFGAPNTFTGGVNLN